MPPKSLAVPANSTVTPASTAHSACGSPPGWAATGPGPVTRAVTTGGNSSTETLNVALPVWPWPWASVYDAT